jgi:hypothetical protein
MSESWTIEIALIEHGRDSKLGYTQMHSLEVWDVPKESAQEEFRKAVARCREVLTAGPASQEVHRG